jgi:hypothetical protein
VILQESSHLGLIGGEPGFKAGQPRFDLVIADGGGVEFPVRRGGGLDGGCRLCPRAIEYTSVAIVARLFHA